MRGCRRAKRRRTSVRRRGYVDELELAERLATLKRAVERGFDSAKLEALEAEVGPDRFEEYIKDWLEAPTLRGRLRRSGLLTTVDE